MKSAVVMTPRPTTYQGNLARTARRSTTQLNITKRDTRTPQRHRHHSTFLTPTCMQENSLTAAREAQPGRPFGSSAIIKGPTFGGGVRFNSRQIFGMGSRPTAHHMGTD